jgi:ATP-binding cassette subfamily F protein 3
MKQRENQLDKIEHITKFIDKFRANAKRSTMVQSRIKVIEKMDVAEDVFLDPECCFNFPDPEAIGSSVMRLDEANIGYGDGEPILRQVNVNVDLETRIALIGPNGAGKSTVVKALCGHLDISSGTRTLNGRCRVGIFTQHHTDNLDLKLTALEQMIAKFPDFKPVEGLRAHLGSFGLSGPLATRPMYLLSGGQKSRVSFAIITFEKPHVLMLDEPTNHLDYDAINALIEGLNRFTGGLVIVSHDEYFLSAICDKLYLVENGRMN